MEETYEAPAITREGTVHELTESVGAYDCAKSGEHPFYQLGDFFNSCSTRY